MFETIWHFFPILTGTVAGGTVGFVFYFLQDIWSQHNWNKSLLYIFITLVFALFVWMGLILGLSATGLWD